MQAKPIITHLYLIPGLAASTSIFNRVNLPGSQIKIHKLAWIAPFANESLSSYAQRMAIQVKESNVVLLGVSFGGIMVQEMAKYINCEKIIVVSSVRNENDFPLRIKFLKWVKLHRTLPNYLLNDLKLLSKFAVGKKTKHKWKLYAQYMHLPSSDYVKWAVDKLVHWKSEEAQIKTIYIHGNKDRVFPKTIHEGCFVVPNGTHLMILNKSKWFNQNLPKLIASN